MQYQPIPSCTTVADIDFTPLFDQIAVDLETHGVAVIPEALPATMALELYHYYRQLNGELFDEAGIGRKQHFHHNEKVRSDKVCWIDGTSATGERWLTWLEMLKVHLNRRLFLGLFSVESHFAHYQKGDFYKRHVDAFRGESNRVLSLVTYLNPQWSETDGGQLVIYHDKSDRAGTKILPRMGTMVLFLSEVFEHEVLPAQKDRYSIASWFRLNTTRSDRADPPR
ncbi:2OG-Fe(II) oxygenase [Salinimonas sp. HHU 13199]|uniref:2OG-Fe(II) oxygenase n=1 Tax=Salinimonas profundi TaxID=2729140 RepID=A0ABR8LFF9_9ALTE|nr:2OG-Fe(II) oxygenase [Salinimonas profundi]MBD3584273.1 2OG-Fe(II) oxygenase [Salinimonas profundi]